MKHIVIVGCSSVKRSGVHAAKDLYTSPLFRLSCLWAEKNGQAWFILSGKYGLMKPDQKLHSYDFSLADAGASERHDWAVRVVKDLSNHLRAMGPGFDRVNITLLAGKAYTDWIRMQTQDVWQPMERLQIRQRLGWLRHQLNMTHPAQSAIDLEGEAA